MKQLLHVPNIILSAIDDDGDDTGDDNDDDDEKKIPGPKVVLPTALGDLQEREDETKETPGNRDLGKV